MTYPNYDPDETYATGQRVLFNEKVYYKSHEGSDLAPGTEGSFWVDEQAALGESAAALAEQIAEVEQKIIAAGMSVNYVRAMLSVE